VWEFRANHLAFYWLEKLTDRPITEIFEPERRQHLTLFYEVLWALSASFVKRVAPEMTFKDLLEQIPTEQWRVLRTELYALVAEALEQGKPNLGNSSGPEGALPPADPDSTGIVDSMTAAFDGAAP
jgi:hypothetical protein